MSELRPNELVDVHIEGARVHEFHEIPDDMPEVTISVESEAGQQFIRLPIGWPNLTVKRRLPAFGDNEAWKDRDGLLWVTQTDPDETDGPVWLFSVIGRVSVEDSHQYAPWTRIYPAGGA